MNWVSPYDAAFAEQAQQHDQSQFTDQYVDEVLEDFQAQQSDFLLGNQEQVPSSQIRRVHDVEQAFIPQGAYETYDDRYELAASAALPRRQVLINAPRRPRSGAFSQVALDLAVRRALDDQKLEMEEKVRKEVEEKERLQFEINKMRRDQEKLKQEQQQLQQQQQSFPLAFARPSAATAPAPVPDASNVFVEPNVPLKSKRQLQDFEIAEQQGLKVLLKKRRSKESPVVYLDEDDDQQQNLECTEQELYEGSKAESFDSGVGTDQGDKYITLKVPKSRVNSAKLDTIKKELQTENTSLTDEQVLASPFYLLSGPDKRRRELLLQSNRQKKLMAKKIEEQGVQWVLMLNYLSNIWYIFDKKLLQAVKEMHFIEIHKFLLFSLSELCVTAWKRECSVIEKEARL